MQLQMIAAAGGGLGAVGRYTVASVVLSVAAFCAALQLFRAILP